MPAQRTACLMLVKPTLKGSRAQRVNPSCRPQGQQERNVEAQAYNNYQTNDKRGFEALLATPPESLTSTYVRVWNYQ